MSFRSSAFRPFATGGRRVIPAIMVTFAVMAVLSVWLTISATSRSRNRAVVVEVAARQRTLAERYVKEVLLVRAGEQADPAYIASLLALSARALLNGGTSPAVNGDDDATSLSPASGPVLRAQLVQERRLVTDLSNLGAAVLAHRPIMAVPLTAGEHITLADPLARLRVVAALTSNVSLNAARTIANQADKNVSDLIVMQVALGAGGLLISLLLASALVVATRRRGADFRALVNASTDLVAVLGPGGCRYASRSLTAMVGRSGADPLGTGFEELVHEDDRALLRGVVADGEPREIVFRMRSGRGDWRYLEAHVSDLRQDRRVRGVVLNARDITERRRLEHELTAQAQRDTFSSQLVEALEMVDEEDVAYDVVERAMLEISDVTPMELLLSDSSRAHLVRAASSPAADPPQCPVQSPFSCVAVRRGNPVVFESSEALNACPKLRDRAVHAGSAVCVPVGFMGRALGVLHATGADGKPPAGEQLDQLTTLATQAGSRIGTVRAFEKSQLQASTDGLTGLLNRRTAESQVRAMLNNGRMVAIVIADLDHFKALNDTHGHEAGDRALRLFAQVTQSALREHDLIARWGGEEFVIVLPELDSHQALSVVERIRAELAESHTGAHPQFTASFGVTDTTAADTLEQLMHIADRGLYRAKQDGRDRAIIGQPSSEPPTLATAPEPQQREHRATGSAAPRRPHLQDAADEEDPRPSGIEIR